MSGGIGLETKFGFTPEEIEAYFRDRRFESLRATHICGLMGMATNTDDTERIAADFKAIADLRKQILAIAPDLRGFDTLSMPSVELLSTRIISSGLAVCASSECRVRPTSSPTCAASTPCRWA